MATPQEQFKPIKELLQVNKESQLGADANGDSFRCLKIDGAIYDPFFRCNLHKDADVFKVRDDDIWIVGYPRSGSHWLWEIVYLLVNKGVPPTNSIAKELFLWELNKKDYFDVISTEERRIFNSHMHSQFIPREVFTTKCKILYLVRDPRDVAVSWFPFLKRLPEYEYNGEWSGFFPSFLDGNVIRGSWFEHVDGWLKQAKYLENKIMVVKYEDLHKDTLGKIREIESFIMPDSNCNELRSLVKSLTSLDNMKEKNAAYGVNYKANADGNTIDKGIIGRWKERLTTSQNTLISKIYKQNVTLFDDMFGLNYCQ